jgi:hypothetical protein
MPTLLALPCLALPAEEVDKIPDDMEGLVSSLDRLEHSLQQAQDYVSAVVVRACGAVMLGGWVGGELLGWVHGQDFVATALVGASFRRGVVWPCVLYLDVYEEMLRTV